jgi:hypothetical protein
MCDLTLDVHTIVCDFEMAMINAIRDQFPKAFIIGMLALVFVDSLIFRLPFPLETGSQKKVGEVARAGH